MIRKSNGRVDHYGDYNPWEEINRELEKECRESGGFVMRTGTVNLKTGFHYDDGLLYVGVKPKENKKMSVVIVGISNTADLVITSGNKLALAPGQQSDAQETVVIGPVTIKTIESIIYAANAMRVFAEN